MDCLFCKIIAGQIPSAIIHENEHAIAFKDIRPVAPSHALVIPRKHVAGIGEWSKDEADLLGRVMLTAKTVAEELGLANSGYRLVLNQGENAGQSVFHLHVHVLGGRAMLWPPG